MDNNSQDRTWRQRALLIYLLAAVLAGVAVFSYLLRIPGDASNAMVLGLSKTRLILALGLLAGIAFFGFGFIKVGRDALWSQRFLDRSQAFLQRNFVYYLAIVILFLIGVICSHLIWLSTVLTDAFLLGYLLRLMPLILWLCFLSWGTIFLLPVLRYDIIEPGSTTQKLVLRLSMIIFGLLLVLWLIIALTGFGIIPDINGWDAPGAPVLPFQAWLAWLIAVIFFIVEGIFARTSGDTKKRQVWIDIVVSLLIYLCAVWVWTSAPLERAYYAPATRPPNFELYPYSDAAMYDSSAQRLLIGEGFAGIARKPLYVFMLAVFHAIAGQDYQAVSNLQVLVLATIPVIVYWLTKSLHTRFSGIVVAGLLTLRETNAIALSPNLRMVHSKILMSDMPVGLGIALLTWLFVTWLQDPPKRRWHPLLVGGVFGLSMLIRSNSVIMLAAILVILVIIFYRKPLNGLFNVALFFLGLALTIIPWMLRSYQMTGRATFNDPRQVAYHAELYAHDVGGFKLPQLPGETEKEYLDRLNQHVVDFTLENPGNVAGFIIPHVLNNQIGSLLNLPMSPWLVQNPNTMAFNYQLGDWPRLWDECCLAHNYVEQMPFWERGWYENLTNEIKLMLAVNLLLIAIGLGVAWMNWGIVGWIPLAMTLAYSLSTAAARFSGWRFALPGDWVTFMYYAIGVGQLSMWAIAYLSGKPRLGEVFPKSEPTWQQVDHMQKKSAGLLRPGIMVGLILLIAGYLPLIVEQSIQPQFSPLTDNDRFTLLEESEIPESISWGDESDLNEYLSSDQAVVLRGKAFYPRYDPAGEGESGTGWPAYSPRNYDRLGFILIGPSEAHVVIALDEPPAYLPNAAEVLVLGCETDDIVEALAIHVREENGLLLVRSPQTPLICPDE